MLELLFHTHIGISMEALLCKNVRIALSCHFALDVPCDIRMSQLMKRRHTPQRRLEQAKQEWK